jgi:hypothetical protein
MPVLRGAVPITVGGFALETRASVWHNFWCPAGLQLLTPRPMNVTVNRARIGSAVLLAAGAAAAGLAPAAHAATGRASTAPASTCSHPAGPRLAPYLTSPCDGATVRPHAAITFTVVDRDPVAATYPPYLSLATTRKVVGGRLAPTLSGEGIFHTLAPVPGSAGTWTYTAQPQSFPSWWDNRPGTYYVQIEQLDTRAGHGTYTSPITTIRVR